MRGDTIYRFGGHCLVPRRRLLLLGGEPVQVGSRAFSILAALVERAGTVVSAQELQRIAWPGVVVEDANLRVQIGSLRRLLEDGASKRRAIETIPLQGYCFVAPVEQVSEDCLQQPQSGIVPHNLPAELTATIGRHETIDALMQAIGRRRLITLTGPGGIGKTTVALAVARKCLPFYPDGVHFVDFAFVSDPRRVPTALASALNIGTAAGDPVAGLVSALSDKRLMLILDTCEHLIEPVTVLAESLLANLPFIRILATSRETLRAAGEWVYRLQPLGSPPEAPLLRAADAIGYPSVELFVQRVAASVDGFELRDCDAPLVGQVCRQLDGIPLAIELAAAHVEEIGLRELVARLSDRLAFLNRGRRTALPRHRTLVAALEWSYQLLSAQERTVLQHLAVFPAAFTAQAARAVATDDMDSRDASATISNLHAKSLITADISSDAVLYRLLDTTRCFAAEKAMTAGDWQASQCRHAWHALEALRGAEREWETSPAAVWTSRHGYLIEDARAALAWAFAPAGDKELAVRLIVASAPLWFSLSLLEEYRRHVEHALAVVGAGGCVEREHRLEDRLRALKGLLVLANTNDVYPASRRLAAKTGASADG